MAKRARPTTVSAGVPDVAVPTWPDQPNHSTSRSAIACFKATASPRACGALRARGTEAAFEVRLLNATLMLAGTFLFSSVMNYLLARWVVTSPAGTEAFNSELGRMTLLSYPVIAIPSMLMMGGVMFYLARGARRLTALELEQMFKHSMPKA